MTVPRGFIWDGVKNDALEVITDGVNTDLSRAFTFYRWREHGGYHVTGSTNLDFFANCSTNEYGTMIAREVAALLDQALEHRLLIANAHRAGNTPSTSWLLVTAYYWCVFLALAWLRLVGKVVTYMQTDEIDQLKRLGRGKLGNKSPRNGTFVVTVLDIEGARSNLQYRRLSTNNFHEGLWNTFYADIQERLKSAAAAREPANWETRLYSALNFRSHFDHTSWLSKLRNAVNYRVGFGYGSVDGSRIPDLLPTLVLAKSANVENLIVHLENMQTKAGGRPVVELPNEYGQLMLLFGALTANVLDEYCSEIWTLRNIDSSWATRRDSFTQTFGETVTTLWPR